MKRLLITVLLLCTPVLGGLSLAPEDQPITKTSTALLATQRFQAHHPRAKELPALRAKGVVHFQDEDGTLTLLSGRDLTYQDITGKLLLAEPTLFTTRAGWIRTGTDTDIIFRRNGLGHTVEHRFASADGKQDYTFAIDLPTLTLADGQTFRFQWSGTDWTLVLDNHGISLRSAKTAVRRGAVTYQIPISLSTNWSLAVNGTGDLAGDNGFRLSRAAMVGADGSRTACTAWTLGRRIGGIAQFTCDDSAMPPAALPYYIDPTTTWNSDAGFHVDNCMCGEYSLCCGTTDGSADFNTSTLGSSATVTSASFYMEVTGGYFSPNSENFDCWLDGAWGSGVGAFGRVDPSSGGGTNIYGASLLNVNQINRTGTSRLNVSMARENWSVDCYADVASSSLSVTYTIPLAITTASLPNGLATTAYSRTLAASGGTPSYTWSLASGALPSGLSLAANGVISGTPTAAGTYSFTVRVTDSTSPTPQTAAKSFSVTIGAALAITTASLPNGLATTAYSQALGATGGTPGYNWTLASGALPAGLSLAANGVISGTPTTPGASSFVVRVTDSTTPTAQTATQSFSITIGAALSITTTSLPNGLATTAYSQTLAATGGTPGYNWTLASGALPAGLSLAANGVISGTPTTPGTSSFAVRVTDATTPTAQTATRNFSITIGAALNITTTSLPNGLATTAYSQTLAATGGTPDYSWALASGALPAGLSLSSSGTISGAPTAAGTYTFTVRATDSTSPTPQTATKSLSITIGPALAITTASLPNGLATTAYLQTLAADGGTPGYSWSLASGALPAGLTLSTSGTISGTPTAAGTYSFTVRATDSTSPTPQTATKSLSITIGAALGITTASLPNGLATTAYSQTLVATGGTPGYSWTLASGALPAGLGLAANGVISGTPTTAGISSFAVRVTDSTTPAAQTATQSLSISIGAALSITTAALPSGLATTAYSQTLTANGGTPAYSWTIASGALPVGLSLAANGVISGTPTTAGTSTFTVRATDSTTPTAQTATQNLSITIGPALSISTTSLPAGQVLSSYSQGLTATGGTPGYSWAVVSGALPAGLSLSAAGTISGTPTAAGNSNFTVRATDSTTPVSQTATANLSITVAPPPPPPAVTLLTPANGATGEPLSPALNWSAASGATSYDVYLGTSNPPALFASSVAATSYVPTPTLSTSTVYYWKIVAKNSGGSSPDSAVWAFTTVPPPPPAVTLLAPTSGATAQPLSPTLSWSAAAGATSYDVYLGTSNPPALAASSITGTSYAPDAQLVTATLYYWKVVAKNSGGSSPDSAIWSFTTVPPAPPAVTLLAPANGATAQALLPTLSWSAASGATSYDVYLGTTNPPALAGNVVSTTYTPGTSLNTSTLYYWKVVAKNTGGSSPDSAVRSFTTVPAPPPAVTLLTPATGGTHQPLSPTLTWATADGATSYDVYLGTSNPPPIAASNVVGTSYTPTIALNAGTPYFWKVIAKNAGGDSPDSAISSFTTGTPPPSVTLSSPVNGASEQPLAPTLAWSAAASATSYDVYLGTTNPPALAASSVTGTSYVPTTTLNRDTTYYWKVVARNSDGSSPDSNVWSFNTIPQPPPAVTLVSPTNGATGQAVSPTLTWSATAGATSYDLYMGTTNPPALAAGNVASTNYTPNPALTVGATYFWKVVAKNSGGSSADSAVWSFTVASVPPAVTLLGPANGATAQPVTAALTWAASSGATSYDVYLGTSNPPSLTASGIAGTSYSPNPDLNASTTYYWKVAAKNGAGSSPDSATWSFTTAGAPPAVTLSIPTNGATGQPVSPTLTWSAAAGATSYDVYIATSNPPALAASNVAGTSYVPNPPLSSSTTYFWKIVAKSIGGSSPDSATWSFTTAAPPPAVTLSAPSNGATGVSVSGTLTWAAATGATSYDVYLGTSNPPALVAAGVPGTSYIPSPALSPAAVHYWKVVAKGLGGTSPDSVTWSFTTAAAPGAVTLSAPANGATGRPVSTAVTWAAATGASSYDVYLGTTNPPTLVASNVAATSYTPTTALSAGTVYYWKIAAKNTGGASESAVWSFTTAEASTVTITSAPAGLTLNVDGTNCTSPCSFQWTTGEAHTIGTSATQGPAGTQYLFSNWSDGGAMTHTISVSAASYTATFATQYYLTTAVDKNFLAGSPGGTPGTITPASGWYDSGATVSVNVTTNPGFQFTGFSGSLTGTATPRNLTMTGPMTVTANYGMTTMAVSPASGPGPTRFTATYTNPNGANSITGTYLLLNFDRTGAGACYVMYHSEGNWLLLFTDDGGAFVPSFNSPGTPGATVSNSQCTVDVGASSVTRDATKVTMSVSITFNPNFKGTRNIYAAADSTLGSGNQTWEFFGTYQAYAGPVVTFTPSGGSSGVSGGPGSVAMQISNGGSWTAVLSESWLHLTSPATGTGNATLNYSVDANPTSGIRSAAITVNGFPFWIQQGPAALYVIGGTITESSVPVPGVSVSLGGSQTRLTTTDGNGEYIFYVSPGSYTVTPSSPGFSFSPGSATYNNISGSQTADFTGTAIPFTISGRVTNASGSGLSGVTLMLAGTPSGSATTNANGDYSFTVRYGGTYTVTPSAGGYSFTPLSFRIADLAANQTQNFTGVANTYSISGRALSNGTGLAGVSISLSGGRSGSAVTDSSGYYSFTNLTAGQDYTVAATKDRYAFNPTSKLFSSLSSNQTQDFQGTANTLMISGKIASGGTGVAGVTVNLSGGSQGASTETDSNGNYTLWAAPGGNYTVTPDPVAYTFTPVSQTYTPLTVDQTLNFEATPRPTVTISGRIMDGTTPVVVVVNLTGPQSKSMSTDSNGRYTFTVPKGGDYTVTPAPSPTRTFNPESRTYPQINGDQTAVDFSVVAGFMISGKVTIGGAPLAGVTINLSGGKTDSTTTDNTGAYTFTVGPGNYTVTASKAGYSLTPNPTTLNIVNANQTANFKITLREYIRLGGRVIAIENKP